MPEGLAASLAPDEPAEPDSAPTKPVEPGSAPTELDFATPADVFVVDTVEKAKQAIALLMSPEMEDLTFACDTEVMDIEITCVMGALPPAGGESGRLTEMSWLLEGRCSRAAL